MSTAENQAVFLSYASQDAEAVERIAVALRAAGVEVWFDKSELTGGDAWDAKIRGQIASCALFVPVISAATQARLEGYFRLEWKLAAQRTHTMADEKVFLLPVVIDDTRDAEAKVPAEFRAVQWTRLPSGDEGAVKNFCGRVGRLLGGGVTSVAQPADTKVGKESRNLAVVPPTSRRTGWVLGSVSAVALVVGAVWWGLRSRVPASSAGKVESTVSAPAGGAATGSRDVGAAASELVRKARELVRNPARARTELEAADRFCRQASLVSELSAELWAVWSLADSWSVYFNFDNSNQRREGARSKAEKALGLEPRGFEARLAQASFLVLANEHNGALSAFASNAEDLLRELRQERPRDPEALLVFGLLQRNLGRRDAARDAFRELAMLPGYAAMAQTELGWAEDSFGEEAAANDAADQAIAAGRYWNSLILKTEMALSWEADAARAGEVFAAMPASVLLEDAGIFEAMQLAWVKGDSAAMLGVVASVPRDWMQSNFFEGPMMYFAGVAHQLAGRREAARQSWTKALQVVERRLAEAADRPETLIWKVRLQALLGESAKARENFEIFQQVSSRKVMRGERPHERAGDYWLLGQEEAAFAHLEDCVRRNAVTWALLKISPVLAPMRGDPRFGALLEKVSQNPRLAPASARARTAAADSTNGQSVAVLAFANLSEDKGNEYFSDGISEELLTVLKKIPGLRVAARTSAFSFKGRSATAQEIGSTLNVAHLVEGSVRKNGNVVKISARLSHAATNEEIWSEDYGPMELTDMFSTQSEIALKIVAGLRGLLTGEAATNAKAEIKAQVQAATKGGTKIPEAHQLYLQARYLVARSGSADVARGIDHYTRALKLDPNFALAWAALARARLWQLSWEPLNPVRAQEARTAATRALELDPDMADAHSVLSQIMLRYSFEWRSSKEGSARALMLAPADAAILTDAAATEQALGSLDRSVELAREAIALDPVSVDPRFYLALSYQFLDRLIEAESETRRMIELSSNGIFSHCLLSCILLSQGRSREALQEAQLEPEKMYRLQSLSAAHFALGQLRESDSALETLIQDFKDIGPYSIAWVYTLRRDRDNAFKWLERAYQLHDAGISWVRADNLFRALHSDPRWPAFLKKIGLSDEQLQ